MQMLKPAYKFKTNIPALIHFESNEPQTGTGQYGEWYRYDIVADGQEQVMFASKGLQEKLNKLGGLFGRDLEITKREGEGNRIFWEIRENGVNITPSFPEAAETTSAAAGEEDQQKLKLNNVSDENKPRPDRIKIVEQRLDKASQMFKNLSERLEKIEREINDLKSKD